MLRRETLSQKEREGKERKDSGEMVHSIKCL